jgi:hypothetical protein
MVTINELVAIVAAVAGKRIRIRHVDGPQGVRGRNSDNDLCRRVLGWEPPTSLRAGLEPTYRWIEQQVVRSARTPASAPKTAAGAHASGCASDDRALHARRA